MDHFGHFTVMNVSVVALLAIHYVCICWNSNIGSVIIYNCIMEKVQEGKDDHLRRSYNCIEDQ